MDRNAACATHADDGRHAIRRRPGDGDGRSRSTLIGCRRRFERSASGGGEPRPALHRPGGGTGLRDVRRRRCAEPSPADHRRISPAPMPSSPAGAKRSSSPGRRRWSARVRVLAALAETAVVTLAGEGAIAFSGSDDVAFADENVEHPVDTTGAGDLLAAAYIWAELRGAEPADRLRWAVLYATLAVETPTGIGGAVREARARERRGRSRSDTSAAGRRRVSDTPRRRQPREPRVRANDLLSTGANDV